jgi:malate permease and related proteins
MIFQLLGKMLILGFAVGLGYYLDRAGKISRQGLQSLSSLVIHYLLPCLAFSALVDHFSLEMLRKAGAMPLIGFLTFTVGMGVGLLTVRWLGLSPAASKTYVFLSSVSNYGYVPLPLVYMLYGDVGAALLFFHNLGGHLFLWTLGVGTLGEGGVSWRRFRGIFNNNLYALLLGIGVSTLGWAQFVPNFVLDFTWLLGMGAVPLVMIVIGSTLAELDSGKVFPAKTMAVMSMVRLLVVPILVISIILLFDMPKSYQVICILVALMPCASSAPLFVQEFGGDKTFAAQAVFVTTLASLITIPIGMSLFLR